MVIRCLRSSGSYCCDRLRESISVLVVKGLWNGWKEIKMPKKFQGISILDSKSLNTGKKGSWDKKGGREIRKEEGCKRAPLGSKLQFPDSTLCFLHTARFLYPFKIKKIWFPSKIHSRKGNFPIDVLLGTSIQEQSKGALLPFHIHEPDQLRSTISGI